MAKLRSGRPIWIEGGARRARRRFPRHRGTTEIDVAIVGGGITGAIADLRALPRPASAWLLAVR